MSRNFSFSVLIVRIARVFGAVLAAALAGAVTGGLADAATFQRLALPGGEGPAIVLSGVIGLGDAAAFHAMAEVLDKAVVITTGPGGLVGPALAIGSEIRARGWRTLVPDGARCASACSLVWLGGEPRLMGPTAQIGFHALSVLQGGRRQETHDADFQLRRWLTELGYPLDATATIVNTGAASIRWLTIGELRANGIPVAVYP